jgi:hypothetical protein
MVDSAGAKPTPFSPNQKIFIEHLSKDVGAALPLRGILHKTSAYG